MIDPPRYPVALAAATETQPDETVTAAAAVLCQLVPLAVALSHNSSSPMTVTTAVAAAEPEIAAPFVDATWSREPVLKSAFLMAMAMAMHFFGYEFARSSNISLFTSKTSGFASPGAFPLAMAAVSPFSLILLMGYGRELELRGPRKALRNTALFCAAVLSLAGGGSSFLEGGESSAFSSIQIPVLGKVTPSKVLIWFSFIFQNSYAHLLYTQHWSFIGSVLTAEEGATWFASVAGLSSISSTIAGALLGRMVDKIGLAGLLGVASMSLIVSMMLADLAYSISEKNGFDPAEEVKKKKQKSKFKSDSIGISEEQKGLIQKTRDMFQRVPVLGALFGEVVSFQSLATILNVCFVTKLKEAVSDDATRAAWTGQFYAAVNGASGVLQFLVLPLFMKRVDPKWVWRIMPLIPVFCTILTSIQLSPSLHIVAFSFFLAKTLDYSLRNVLNEMVYIPLDFDSRFLGKEVIGVFGNRFGKSGISLLLSGLSYMFGNFGAQDLSRCSALASVTWFSFAYRLSSLIPPRQGSKESAAEGAKEEKRE